ncbi:MAG: hypothetical protein J0H82_25440 [Alphaproteobacteria bacterium]|jgi:hypothetical protein|nr:hypothetical protein [Alphaproteobacteria bacterium]
MVSLDPSLSIGSAAAEAERLRRSRSDALALEAERRRRSLATDGQDDQETSAPAVDRRGRDRGGNQAFGVAATPRFLAEPELVSAAKFAAQLSAQDDEVATSTDAPRRALADAAYRSAQGRGVSFVAQGPSLDLTI